MHCDRYNSGIRRFHPAAILIALLATGCADNSKIPFAGFWQGEFQGAAPEGQKMRPEWSYKGWMQVYVTGTRYKMHLESIGQIVDISGTWKNKADRLYLNASEIKFDDRGGAMMRPEGVKPIPPEDVRTAYSKPMVLVMQPGNQQLVSLDMTVGPVLGKHVFTKGGE